MDVREHPPHAGVVEQWLVVPDQEVIELQVRFRDEHRNSKNVGRDFVDRRHGQSPAPRQDTRIIARRPGEAQAPGRPAEAGPESGLPHR